METTTTKQIKWENNKHINACQRKFSLTLGQWSITTKIATKKSEKEEQEQPQSQ